ncbi:MAG: hypothetical protein ABF584_05260 [Acetobacter sp.]
MINAGISVVVNIPIMLGPVFQRYQAIHILANHVGRRAAPELFSRSIEKNNVIKLVNNNNAIGRLLEHIKI